MPYLQKWLDKNISIHALRGEGDQPGDAVKGNGCAFQSTPSVGRATFIINRSNAVTIFQSTPSVGRATRIICLLLILKLLFQSTPSVGRATNLKK